MKELPLGWVYAKPHELASSEKYALGIGPFGSNLKVSDYATSGVPLVFVRNIRAEHFGGDGTKYVSEEKAVDLSAHAVLPGDVLITKMGDPPGDSALYPLSAAPGIITADCIRWRIHDAAGVPLYFVYVTRSAAVQMQVADITRGVAQRKVSLARFKSVEYPVAPLPEQHRIVAALDSYFTRLDDAVATLERVQANLKRYRASVLQAAVEGRLVPTEAELARAEKRDYEPASVLLERILVERRRRWEEAELAKMKAKGKPPKNDKWKAKYKEPAAPDTEGLPELPEGWYWASLEQLGTWSSGGTPSRSRPEYFGEGYSWVRTGDLFDGPINVIPESITQAGLDNSSAKLFPPGSLLIAMYGATIGKLGVLKSTAATNQACAVLLAEGRTAKLIPYTFFFLFQSRDRLKNEGQGGAQPNISQTILRPFQIPLPPLAEQDRIVEELDAALSQADHTNGVIQSVSAKADRLRQSILKWAFEGRLADQDPNDDPASVLLGRIKAEREAAAAKAKPKKRGRRKTRSKR